MCTSGFLTVMGTMYDKPFKVFYNNNIILSGEKLTVGEFWIFGMSDSNNLQQKAHR